MVYTVRINPKFTTSVVEGLALGESNDLETRITFHGGKFKPVDIENALIKNPSNKYQIDAGQKVRISGVFENGRTPEQINNELFLRVNPGDLVYFFNSQSKAIKFSRENPNVKVLTLNQKRQFTPYEDEITLGDGDCTLRCTEIYTIGKHSEYYQFGVLKSNGRIFSNHGVIEPASINNREKLLVQTDLELLDIVKRHFNQVSDVVISFISSSSHVDQLYKVLSERFKIGMFPKITFKVETLKAVVNLNSMIDRALSLGINPEIIIGCGDLESQVKESLPIGSTKAEVNSKLEEKIEEIVNKLSRKGYKSLNIAWGLGEDNDTSSKLRKIISLEMKYGISIDYWVTKATIGKTNATEVTEVLKRIDNQRKIVLKGLFTNLVGEVVGDII